MPAEYRKERRVQFSETDMAGIIHYSSYFQFMEETEHEFMRSLGLSIHLQENGITYGFPRLSTRCEYSRPLRFEDLVDVHLRVTHIGETSLTYQFFFSLDGEEVARGEVSIACVFRDETGKMKSSKLPEPLSAQLSLHPGEPLTFGPRRRDGG